MPGLTAYVGLSEIGRPQRGETVVVSAASGAVGAVAGQLAKRAGARVVGIAGGADKCRYVEGELGFDACMDHRSADLGAALDRACPKGIDVYWENVGGAVQQAVFPRLNDFGRMVMCGMVSEYNDVEPRPGPNLTPAVRKRLKIQGFIVSDLWQRFGEYRAMAAPLVRSGELKYREDIAEGLGSGARGLHRPAERPQLRQAPDQARRRSDGKGLSSARKGTDALDIDDRDNLGLRGLPVPTRRYTGCGRATSGTRMPRLRHAGNGEWEIGAGQGTGVRAAGRQLASGAEHTLIAGSNLCLGAAGPAGRRDQHPCTAIAEPVPNYSVGMQQLYGAPHGRRAAAAGLHRGLSATRRELEDHPEYPGFADAGLPGAAARVLALPLRLPVPDRLRLSRVLSLLAWRTLFFGLAPSIVVVQRFHHFHDGFPRGFAHGFAGGFGPSFGIARGGGCGGRR
jgi:hypothetical protein